MHTRPTPFIQSRALIPNSGPRALAGWAALQLALALVPRQAHADPTAPDDPASPQASAAAEPVRDDPLPIRNIDRPTTLATGVLRLDTDVQTVGAAGTTPSVDALVGLGLGLGSQLEVGAQAIPLSLVPTFAYTQPTLYVTWGANLGQHASVAPTVQAGLPIQQGDTWLIDVDTNAALTLGKDWELAASPSLSLAPGDALGSSLSLPITLLWQARDRVFLQALSGVGLDAFDVRRQISHSQEPIDFQSLTVPAGLSCGATLGRDGGPLADLQVQADWPQLYRSQGETGGQTGGQTGGLDLADWSVLLLAQTSIPGRRHGPEAQAH